MPGRSGFLILLLIFQWNILLSQELSNQVLVPIAGISESQNLEYTYTIGEAAVEILSSHELVVTQGFQQPRFIFRKEVPPMGNGANVYPNPVTDVINVELFGDKDRTYTVEILNIAGIILISEKLSFTGTYWQIRQYPATGLSRGFYLVRITSDDAVISRIFKLNKM